MATKTRKKQETAALGISKDNAEHLRRLSEQIASMQLMPQVSEYISLIRDRESFIRQCAQIAGIHPGDTNWTIDLEKGCFRRPKTNGEVAD